MTLCFWPAVPPGKNVVQLDLHTQLMALRLEEMRSCAAAAGQPASSSDKLVPPPPQQAQQQQGQQRQLSGEPEQGAALCSMLRQQVGALGAPATLWELHTSRAAGGGEAEDAEQARQPKRRRGPAWRGAQHAQHGMVPLLPKRNSSVKEAAAAAASGRYPDPIPPFRQLAEGLGLLGGAASAAPVTAAGTAGREQEGSGARQPAQRMAAAGAAAATQQQQQQVRQGRHQGQASAGPKLFPPPAWLDAALSLPEAGAPGAGTTHAGPSTAAAQQGIGSKGGQALQWQATVHLPAVNVAASSGPHAREAIAQQNANGLHPLKGDPHLGR